MKREILNYEYLGVTVTLIEEDGEYRLVTREENNNEK
jgi:hypothetical protein